MVRGRKKEFEERLLLPITGDMLARIDAALREGEIRVGLIRSAISAELDRRESEEAQPMKASA